MTIVRECVRCKANKKDGTQCKRKTCKISDYCYQHLKIEKQLQVKKSAIQGSGQGLYTTKKIKKGEKVVEYGGNFKTKARYEATDSGYGIQFNKNLVLDGNSTQHGNGRYANDCRSKNKKKKECKGNNSRFSTNTSLRTASPKATKTIPANTEVFVNYGNDYWSE